MVSPVKSLLSIAIGQAVAFGFASLSLVAGYPEAFWLTYMASGCGGGLVHYLHLKVAMEKNRRNERKKQILTRRNLKAKITGDRIADLLLVRSAISAWTMISRDGKAWRFPSMQWLNVDALDDVSARYLLAPMILDWLYLPDPEDGDSKELRERKLKAIWTDLRFHPEEEL